MFEKPEGGGLKKPRALKETIFKGGRMRIDMISTNKSIFTAGESMKMIAVLFQASSLKKKCKSPSFWIEKNGAVVNIKLIWLVGYVFNLRVYDR